MMTIKNDILFKEDAYETYILKNKKEFYRYLTFGTLENLVTIRKLILCRCGDGFEKSKKKALKRNRSSHYKNFARHLISI